MSNPLTRFAESMRSYWTGPLGSRDPASAEALWAQPTSTGIAVTSDTAFNSSAFWSAVSIIAGDTASVPLELLKRDKDGGSTPQVDSKTYELVHDAPNPEMTSMVFREAVQGHALTWGNGYAEIERDGGGRPLALWPLTPNRVTPFRQGGDVYYRVTNVNSPEAIVPAEDMIHIPGLGFDGLMGYSVIEKARDSISMGMAMQKFGGKFFGNGSAFGGVMSFPGKLTKEVKQGIRESIDAVHTGVDRAHKFVIFGDGAKYEKFGIPPNDAQFLESRRFEIEEIARWFHMPQHKLNGLDHATFSNIEHLDLDYFKSCLRGWFVRWEQELKRKLVPSLERKQLYFRHNVEGFLRGDSAARAEFYSKMFNIGAYSINMILEKENMNGIGPDGDAHLVPVNLTKIARVDELINAQIASKTAPPQPPQGPDTTQQNAFHDLLMEISENAKAIHATLGAQRAATTQAEIEALTTRLQTLQGESAHLQGELLDLRAMAEAETTAREAAEVAQRALDAKSVELATLSDEAHAAAAVKDEALRVEITAKTQAVSQLTEATARLDAIVSSQAKHRADVLLAHRALIVDVMGRMVRRETEKARRQQATPAKLLTWVETFYVTHEDVCVDALRPAVRAHLAWTQADDDPDVVTRGYIQAHIADSIKHLKATAAGDPEDFSLSLERLLTRWEQQRSEAFADRLLAAALVSPRSA